MDSAFKRRRISPYSPSSTSPLSDKIFPKMASSNRREVGWTDSSESEDGSDHEEAHDAQVADNSRNPPGHRASRVPVVEFDHQIIDLNRGYWNCYLIGVLIDCRQFTVRRMQAINNIYWQLQGVVIVVGRDDRGYIIHFQHMEELIFIHTNGPWAMQGGLLTTIVWEPNMIVNQIHVREVPV